MTEINAKPEMQHIDHKTIKNIRLIYLGLIIIYVLFYLFMVIGGILIQEQTLPAHLTLAIYVLAFAEILIYFVFMILFLFTVLKVLNLSIVMIVLTGLGLFIPFINFVILAILDRKILDRLNLPEIITDQPVISSNQPEIKKSQTDEGEVKQIEPDKSAGINPYYYAYVALFLFCIPFLGLPVSIFALYQNYKSEDKRGVTLSWIALVINIFMLFFVLNME